MIKIDKIIDSSKKENITNNILRNLPEWFGVEQSIKEYVENVKDTDFYIAYELNIPIGFVSIKYNNSFTAEIYVMGILKEYHNQKIGKMLINKIQEDLKKDNYKFLMVKTLGKSHPDKFYKITRHFYISAGFYPLE